MLANEICLKTLGDQRGRLIAIEELDTVPFRVRRAYYIFDTKKGVERGLHAHKELKQFAVAVSGSCEMILDDGSVEELVVLDSPNKGVIINSGVWHVMRNFSESCVLHWFLPMRLMMRTITSETMTNTRSG